MSKELTAEIRKLLLDKERRDKEERPLIIAKRAEEVQLECLEKIKNGQTWIERICRISEDVIQYLDKTCDLKLVENKACGIYGDTYMYSFYPK